MVAAAIGVSAAAGLAGSAISSSASKSAADTQAQAAQSAAQVQQNMFNTTQNNLAPYMNLGSSNIGAYQAALDNPALTATFSAPSAADAAATPGYQFTLTQGLKSTQNSAAARGLGSSGAALKGAETYATGLADSTYNDVYNRALSTYQTNYNSAAANATRLGTAVNNGQNAAAGLGSIGQSTATSIGNSLTSAGNATAAGTVGSANAVSSGLSSVGSNALLASMYGTTNNASSSAYGNAYSGFDNPDNYG